MLKIIYKNIETEKLWDLYLVNFSHMDKNNFESFEDYKNRVKSVDITSDKLATVEEVIEEMEEVMAAFSRKGG